ncbi:MAG: tetraacyldisaccharide 4'-kinase [Blastocatellia bacterium]
MILPPISQPVLYLPAKLYELGVRSRIALYERGILTTHKLQAPVISVGNLTVGGTGKTPCVAFLARLLRDAGHDVAILSRGYKRSSEGRVEVSNGRDILCEPSESGDEPYLLAKLCPGVRVIVDRDRYAAGRWLEERTKISAFILDDGFQHLRLSRDLDLLLVDASEPLAEAKMVPFGRLREPLAGLRRADAVIVTRSDRRFDREALEATVTRHCRPRTPVFYARHEMTALRRLDGEERVAPADFMHRPVAAVSGIAKPDHFVNDLSRAGMGIVLRRDLDDHHRYLRGEFALIVESARAAGAEAIIVTEKDAANLSDELVRSSALPVYAAQIEFRCEDEEGLKELVLGICRNTLTISSST